MKTIEEWLTAYGRDHQNPINQKIHKVCVPLILWSVLALLWLLKVPGDIPFLNGGTIITALGLLFYLRLDRWLFVMMFFITLGMLTSIHYMAMSTPLFTIALTVFILSWIGQFIGHKIEGQKPSFLEDIQFLLIGPLWVIKDIRFPPKA